MHMVSTHDLAEWCINCLVWLPVPVVRVAFGTSIQFVPLTNQRKFELPVERKFLEGWREGGGGGGWW